MPMYHNNCPACRSLGAIVDGGKHYDLYYCDKDNSPVIKARFGDLAKHVHVQSILDCEGSVMLRGRDKARQAGLLKPVGKQNIEQMMAQMMGVKHG